MCKGSSLASSGTYLTKTPKASPFDCRHLLGLPLSVLDLRIAVNDLGCVRRINTIRYCNAGLWFSTICFDYVRLSFCHPSSFLLAAGLVSHTACIGRVELRILDPPAVLVRSAYCTSEMYWLFQFFSSSLTIYVTITLSTRPRRQGINLSQYLFPA